MNISKVINQSIEDVIISSTSAENLNMISHDMLKYIHLGMYRVKINGTTANITANITAALT